MFKYRISLPLLVIAFLALGCQKKSVKTSEVSFGDLYSESINAAASYLAGAAVYKPKKEGVTITAKKAMTSNSEGKTVDGINIVSTGRVGDITMEFRTTYPLDAFATEESGKLLDAKAEALRLCLVKALKTDNAAENPLTSQNTCSIGNLTYNGHPGLTINSGKGDGMEIWIFNETKVAAQ